MPFTLTGTRQPREAGDICPPPGSVKRNPPSCEAGEGLTPWSHLSGVIGTLACSSRIFFKKRESPAADAIRRLLKSVEQ